jgi:hypothetical protein
MPAVIPKHIIRYGAHPEKIFFEADRLYDGVLLNANTVAYSTRGIAEFLVQHHNKPFCIDPLTHSFGHSPVHIAKSDKDDTIVVRSAFVSLAEHYGEPVSSTIGKRGLTPKDFQKSEIVRGFCERVIDFQKGIIAQQMSEDGADKYIELKDHMPWVVMAPYFYMNSSTFSFWLDLNRKFIDLSLSLETKLPVFGYILISKDAFFDDSLRNQLTDNYLRTEAPGFMLWIESFSEHDATRSELEKYRDFVSKMSVAGKKLISLYGGYFSIILQKFGLYGVTHGPGYGEERDVTPVGGGLPKPKFYFPSLHDRLQYREVLFAIRKRAQLTTTSEYYRDVCDCACCKKVIDDDISNFRKYGESKSGIRRDGISFEYQTTRAKNLNTTHYLLNKDMEFKFVADKSISALKDDLDESLEKYQGMFDLERLGHLKNWSDALS